MSTQKIQDKLFAQLKESLPEDSSIADVVSEVLHVSTDSAYRRIRGETPLVLDELAAICKHFNLSIDQLVDNQNNTVVFQNRRVHNEKYTYAGYLEDLKQQLQSLERFSKKEVIYQSKDLPIFYNFYFRPLVAFRYYFWMKIQLLHPDFENRYFDTDILPDPIEKMSTELIRGYCGIPSTEMWNIESINSTISQIEFSRTSGHFKNQEDIIRVYEALESTILHIQEQAEQGSKYMPGEDPAVQPQNFRFFFNRVALADNTIMTVTDGFKRAFINYGHLNYLVTADPQFCDDLFHDFENLKRRSTLISVTGERQRNIFFNILLSKVRERKRNAG